ncbi:MAG TPA: hypothetical protein VH277_11560 [Gemmatimonadaceae bacterium]|jgi:hypothetical protein|nr:hypothetical protein [Gemmatimonadaceae bacterium]
MKTVARFIRWSGLVALAGLVAARAGAQSPAPSDRLAPSTRAALDRLLDSARAFGLPTAPLTDKAAEGVLKGADDDRILRAVQSLLRDYIDARGAIGANVSPGLLGAAASALHAGLTTADLRRLARASGARVDDASLESAFVTIVDLVARRVPATAAANAAQTLLSHRAGDREFAALRAGVEEDVLAGRPSEASLADRMRIQLHALDPASMDGVVPRRPPPG